MVSFVIKPCDKFRSSFKLKVWKMGSIPAGNYMFKVNNKTLEQGVKYVQS